MDLLTSGIPNVWVPIAIDFNEKIALLDVRFRDECVFIGAIVVVRKVPAGRHDFYAMEEGEFRQVARLILPFPLQPGFYNSPNPNEPIILDLS